MASWLYMSVHISVRKKSIKSVCVTLNQKVRKRHWLGYTFRKPCNNITRSPLAEEPESPLAEELESPFTGEPESPFTGEPVSSFTGELESSFTGELESPYTAELESPFTAELESPFTGEPESPFTGEPESPFTGKPESSFIGKLKSPFTMARGSNRQERWVLLWLRAYALVVESECRRQHITACTMSICISGWTLRICKSQVNNNIS